MQTSKVSIRRSQTQQTRIPTKMIRPARSRIITGDATQARRRICLRETGDSYGTEAALPFESMKRAKQEKVRYFGLLREVIGRLRYETSYWQTSYPPVLGRRYLASYQKIGGCQIGE